MLAVNVTGHRQIVPAGEMGSPWPDANANVAKHHMTVMGRVAEILSFWQEKNGLKYCISGMALGADTIFAEAVVHMKNLGWPVELIAAIPFKGQEGRWNSKSQMKYHEILRYADQIKVVCEGSYAPYKMQVRNEWMVDNAHFTLAIWGGSRKGGTWNCIQYALSKGKVVWHLHPQTLECKILEI